MILKEKRIAKTYPTANQNRSHLKKLTPLLVLLTILTTPSSGQTQPYGIIDTADLKMTTCDFEMDANAMVLFDYAVVTNEDYTIKMQRHKRIKIFNNNAKDIANIRIEFEGSDNDERITDVEAETINLNNNTIEYTDVDKKLIYTEHTDKNTKAIVFTFPNVKPGSVLEFVYKWTTGNSHNYPDWIFQSSIPCRYSEFDATFANAPRFSCYRKVLQPLFRDSTLKLDEKRAEKHIWALKNVPSFNMEPYMDYPEDYLQRIVITGWAKYFTWAFLSGSILADENVGEQLDKNLENEDKIITKAKALKTTDQRISYIFDTVKNTMKWNKLDYDFAIDGVKKCWDKKTGNSTEINLILFDLLKKANVNCSLLVLCTRNHGKIDPQFPGVSHVNRTVIYYPVDSARYYVLDASNPYNNYNSIPPDLIDLNALLIDPSSKNFSIKLIKNEPAREVIIINGSIGADGRLLGNTRISCPANNREKYLRPYNEQGEKKYIEQLQDKFTGLKITDLKVENLAIDTLPFEQTFEFKYNLTAPDGNYLYFNPNSFSVFEKNPFLSDTRISAIELGRLNTYLINGRYTIPPGYKIDVLPKYVTMSMPDRAITFTRFTAQQEGVMVINFTIKYNRSLFSKEEYPSIRDFYKKMYELLNEPIVLKKG